MKQWLNISRHRIQAATAIAFGIAGSILLFQSHALTPTASLQAEDGVTSSAVTMLTDTTASNNGAIKFGPANASTIPGTIASDCSVDVTAAMQAWIDATANNTLLIFGTNKCYRIDGTIELRTRSTLAFSGNGSTFKSLNAMTTGSSTDDQRAMFRIIGSSGFSFKNMTIIGAYTHGGTLDDTLQHAHGIDIRGTSADIDNVTVSNVAGDCFYYGLGYDNITRSSGNVTNSSCASIGRNGLAVTSANNMTISNNSITNVGFDAFDIEPNVGTYTATTGWGSNNITITGNTITGYYRLYAFSIVTNATNSHDTFSNNHVVSNGLRIGIVNPAGAGVRPDNVTITNNTADNATNSPAIEVHLVDILNVTGNTIPMTGGTMATTDLSCRVTVTGNTFTGGSSQVTSTNPTTGC